MPPEVVADLRIKADKARDKAGMMQAGRAGPYFCINKHDGTPVKVIGEAKAIKLLSRVVGCKNRDSEWCSGDVQMAGDNGDHDASDDVQIVAVHPVANRG